MAEKNITIKDLIRDIDYRLTHIEDCQADNRQLMIKLIKQSNRVVEFLRDMEKEVMNDPDYPGDINVGLPQPESSKKINSVQELFAEFMEKREDLKEFEEELQKHKDEITPGQVGES